MKLYYSHVFNYKIIKDEQSKNNNNDNNPCISVDYILEKYERKMFGCF